jgi:hypothetical protein
MAPFRQQIMEDVALKVISDLGPEMGDDGMSQFIYKLTETFHKAKQPKLPPKPPQERKHHDLQPPFRLSSSFESTPKKTRPEPMHFSWMENDSSGHAYDIANPSVSQYANNGHYPSAPEDGHSMVMTLEQPEDRVPQVANNSLRIPVPFQQQPQSQSHQAYLNSIAPAGSLRNDTDLLRRMEMGIDSLQLHTDLPM